MDEFTCAKCGGTFPKLWSDEDAWGEAASAFTPAELSDPAMVCEDCWQEMRAGTPGLDARYKETPR